MNEIPDELVENIFMRLSVKSLKRFSCINKLWYNFIHSPYFISQHHSHHSSLNQNQNQKLLVKHSLGDHLTTGKDVISLLSQNQNQNQNPIPIPIPFLNQNNTATVIGPCINGIICLKIFTLRQSFHDIALWNFATGDFIMLPKLNLSTPFLLPDMGGLGFGWVPETNDFKVLTLVVFWPDCTDLTSGPTVAAYRPSEFLVYTLSTNSWKKLSCDPCSLHICSLNSVPPHHSQICVNGVCYWVASTLDRINRIKIISFHMRDEVFGTLQLPDIGFNEHDCFELTLHMFDGSIALLMNNLSDVTGSPFLADIWVMEESWIKKFTIGPLVVSNICVGLGLVKDELYWEDVSGQLSSINVNSHKVKNLGIRGATCSNQVVEYVESLVPLKRLS